MFMGSFQEDQPQLLLSGGADSLLRQSRLRTFGSRLEPAPLLAGFDFRLCLSFRPGVSDNSGEETGLFCLV